MASKNLLALAVSFVLIGTISGKAIENSKDVVWFPNPNGDGTLLEARLYPTPGLTRAGNLSDIHFLLFTGENPDDHDELHVDDVDALRNSHFLENRPLKMMFHGFGGAHDHSFPWQSFKEYLSLDGNQNFILVNWTVLAASPDYFGAVANAQVVSRLSADLLEFLIGQGVVQRQDIHLIGFSLGGQVVGQIGSRVAEKLTRITSLDPALPLFDVADNYNKTDPSDAEFVDVMHTAGVILGYFDPCGTVDWYPNGGKVQPGCGVDLTGSCAHQRAPAMWKESLTTTIGFRGVHCSNWQDYQDGLCNDNESAYMGHYTPLNTTGVFFLASNEESPYAQG